MKKVSLWVGPNRFITHLDTEDMEFLENYIGATPGMELVYLDCREHKEIAQNDPLDIRVKATSVDAYRVLGDV